MQKGLTSYSPNKKYTVVKFVERKSRLWAWVIWLNAGYDCNWHGWPETEFLSTAWGRAEDHVRLRQQQLHLVHLQQVPSIKSSLYLFALQLLQRDSWETNLRTGPAMASIVPREVAHLREAIMSRNRCFLHTCVNGFDPPSPPTFYTTV